MTEKIARAGSMSSEDNSSTKLPSLGLQHLVEVERCFTLIYTILQKIGSTTFLFTGDGVHFSVPPTSPLINAPESALRILQFTPAYALVSLKCFHFLLTGSSLTNSIYPVTVLELKSQGTNPEDIKSLFYQNCTKLIISASAKSLSSYITLSRTIDVLHKLEVDWPFSLKIATPSPSFSTSSHPSLGMLFDYLQKLLPFYDDIQYQPDVSIAIETCLMILVAQIFLNLYSPAVHPKIKYEIQSYFRNDLVDFLSVYQKDKNQALCDFLRDFLAKTLGWISEKRGRIGFR